MEVIREYTRMYKPQQLLTPFDRAFLDMSDSKTSNNGSLSHASCMEMSGDGVVCVGMCRDCLVRIGQYTCIMSS